MSDASGVGATSDASHAEVGSPPFDGEVTRADVVARIQAHPLGDGPDAMRRDFARLVGGTGDVGSDVRVQAIERGGTDGLLVRPRAAVDGEGRRIVWFHGGGYVFGAPETHLRPAAFLAGLADVPVFLPRYRLAPEHPWPAAFEDAMAAVRHAKGGPLVLVGDSAGGHLALNVALALAREGMPAVGLVLLSPNTDRSGLSETRERNGPSDPMVDDEGDRAMARLAFGDGYDRQDPQVSPLLADLSLLPPTHVEVGEGEVLLGDSLLLARRATNARASVSVHVDPNGLHMGQAWAPWWPVARASLERVARFVRGGAV